MTVYRQKLWLALYHVNPHFMQELIDKANSYQPLSLELTTHLLTVLQWKTYAKGSLLLKAGQVSRRVNFVQKGLLRAFATEGEKEFTHGFFAEGEVMIGLTSFESQTPSLESVEAMEDTSILYLSYEDLQFIFATYPEADKIARLIFANAQKIYTDQKNHLTNLSSKDRYTWFTERYPHLVQRVAGKYIASFLGMTEVTLSRVRGKL